MTGDDAGGDADAVDFLRALLHLSPEDPKTDGHPIAPVADDEDGPSVTRDAPEATGQ